MALGRVPEPYRSIIVMREVQGMSYEEIADALDMPLNTIKVYLHRGRKMLQAQLLEYARKKGILSGPSDVATDGDAAS